MSPLVRRMTAGAAAPILAISGLAATSAGAGADPVPTLNHDEAFVTAAYQDFLGRPPTSQELQAATHVSLVSVAARHALASTLSTSPEWLTTTVDKLYLDTMGRGGDTTGVAYWVSELRSGSMSVPAVAAAFYSSHEYFVGFGHSDVHTWIMDLYSKILLRDGSADPGGVSYWVSTTGSVGRERVAYSIYQSNESRHTRVAGLYEKLLGREPDRSGWDYWAGVVGSVGDLSLAANLASSSEYASRAYARYPVLAVPGTWYSVEGASMPLPWVPTAVGDKGVVVGITSDSRPVVCTAPCTTPTLLPTLSGHTLIPTAVSPTGEIIGHTSNGDSTSVGVDWTSASATPTLLAAPTGDDYVVPVGVNASGEIVGTGSASLGPATTHGLVWTSESVSPTEISPSGDYTSISLSGISTAGEIVGNAHDNGQSVGLAWESPTSVPAVLARPAGPVDQFDQTVTATGITPAGTIYGWAALHVGSDPTILSAVDYVTVWANATAVPVILATPNTGSSGYPVAMSSTGEVIGSSPSASPSQDQLLAWTSTSAAATVLTVPQGTNNVEMNGLTSSGVIFGQGGTPPNEHGIMWTTSSASPTVLRGVMVKRPPAVLHAGPNGAFVGSTGSRAVFRTAAVWSSPWAAPTPLATPDRSIDTDALDISTTGEIVGTGEGLGTQAVEWSSASASPITLALPSGYYSSTATAVSSSGEIVGSATNSLDHQVYGLVWTSASATASLLMSPSGFTSVAAVDVSDSGVIVGNGTDSAAMPRGLVWSAMTATPTELSMPAGYTGVTVLAVTTSGEIVGTGTDASGHVHGLVWASASASATVPAGPAGTSGAVPLGVSQGGVIVGTATTDASPLTLVVWSSSTAAPQSAAPPTGVTSVSSATVNDAGQIVVAFAGGAAWRNP